MVAVAIMRTHPNPPGRAVQTESWIWSAVTCGNATRAAIPGFNLRHCAEKRNNDKSADSWPAAGTTLIVFVMLQKRHFCFRHSAKATIAPMLGAGGLYEPM